MRRVGRALLVVTTLAASACGLDVNGLLDAPDGGGGGGLADAVAFDATQSDAPGATEAGGDDATTRGDASFGGDDTGAEDAASEGGESGASGDDSGSIGPGDAAPEAAVDAAPILWDGGAITDPQFDDGDWVAFCAALVACGEMSSMSACVAFLHQPASPDALIPPPHLVQSVLNAAPNCNAVANAVGDGTGCSETTPDTCSGSSLVTCRWGFRMTVDCASLGMVCSNGAGNAGCGFGDCNPSQEGLTYCVGPSYVALCDKGRYVPALDCQTFGAACSASAPGGPGCVGTGGPACGGGAGCSGTKLVDCFGGLFGSVDCSSAYGPSFQCLQDSSGDAVCAAGTACDGTMMDSCQGSVVTFCNGGAQDTFDCSRTYSGCKNGACTP